MNNNTKFEEELTFQLKIDMRNLTNFDLSTRKLHFNRLLLTKVYNAEAKKSIDELCLMALKIDVKFEGKLICAFEKFSITGWKIVISL